MGKDGKVIHERSANLSQWTPINSRQHSRFVWIHVQINVQCLVRIPQMKGAKREILMASWTLMALGWII